MTDETERLVAEIPQELKELVDADRRTNKEVVQAALWREFGGERKGALERRIEEKERRISMIESERNERNREIENERQELEALKAKRQSVEEKEQEEQSKQEQLWSEAMNAMEVKEIGGTKVITSENRFIEEWAGRLNLSVAEFKEEVLDRAGDS